MQSKSGNIPTLYTPPMGKGFYCPSICTNPVGPAQAWHRILAWVGASGFSLFTCLCAPFNLHPRGLSEN